MVTGKSISVRRKRKFEGPEDGESVQRVAGKPGEFYGVKEGRC